MSSIYCKQQYLFFSSYLRIKQAAMIIHVKVLKKSSYLMKQNINNNKSDQSKVNQIVWWRAMRITGGLKHLS